MSTYVALFTNGGKPQERAIEISEAGEDVYEVRIDDATFRVDARRLDRGNVSLLVDAASYAVELEAAGESAVNVLVKESVFKLDVLDERRLRMRRASGHFAVEGKAELRAPMPGKVVKVLAKAGDEVKEGQGLVVVEAMKMENELKSPKAGKVTEVCVAEGQAVEGGAKLVVVE